MARNGTGGILVNHPFVCLPNCMTLFASSKSFFANACVCFVVFVSFWAMCFCFLTRSVGFSSKRKTIPVNPSIFAKNFSKGKPLLCSFCDGVRLHANGFCEVCGFVFLALNNNKFSISTIQLLLRSSGPLTIFWRVSKIVVYSVERVTFGPFPHVGHKVFKALAATNRPAITNGYAPASITGKLFKVWIFASDNHSMPA